MRFIDFFAGVGGFRSGLELAGHKCVGFCEWDKYATASYTSMHLSDGTVTISEEIYKELREKAANYEELVNIVSKAIQEAIKGE